MWQAMSGNCIAPHQRDRRTAILIIADRPPGGCGRAKPRETPMNVMTPIVRDPKQEKFDTRSLLAHARAAGR